MQCLPPQVTQTRTTGLQQVHVPVPTHKSCRIELAWVSGNGAFPQEPVQAVWLLPGSWTVTLTVSFRGSDQVTKAVCSACLMAISWQFGDRVGSRIGGLH